MRPFNICRELLQTYHKVVNIFLYSCKIKINRNILYFQSLFAEQMVPESAQEVIRNITDALICTIPEVTKEKTTFYCIVTFSKLGTHHFVYFATI